MDGDLLAPASGTAGAWLERPGVAVLVIVPTPARIDAVRQGWRRRPR